MFLRKQIIGNLKSMRDDIEASRQMPFEQACMLYDTCAAIGFYRGRNAAHFRPSVFCG
jgi:hypothetical protein